MAHPLIHAGLVRTEAALFRGVMALPPALLRRLAGKPVILDGQVLDPETQFTLRLKELLKEPGVETLPIPEGAGRHAPRGQARRRPAADRRGARPAGGRWRRCDRGAALRADVAGRPARPFAAAGVHPRRRDGLRRPGLPRRGVPVPGRAGRRTRARPGLPARPRAPVPRGRRGLLGGVPVGRGARRRPRGRPGADRGGRRLGRRVLLRRRRAQGRGGRRARATSSCWSTR